MRLHMQLHATNAQPAVLPFLTRDHPDLLHACRHRYAIHVYIFVGTYTRATLTARLALLSRWTDTNRHELVFRPSDFGSGNAAPTVKPQQETNKENVL